MLTDGVTGRPFIFILKSLLVIIRLLGSVTVIVDPSGILLAVVNGMVSAVGYPSSLSDYATYCSSMFPTSEFLMIKSSSFKLTNQ